MNDLWFLQFVGLKCFTVLLFFERQSALFISLTHTNISACVFFFAFCISLFTFHFPKLCFTSLQKHTIADVDTILFFPSWFSFWDFSWLELRPCVTHWLDSSPGDTVAVFVPGPGMERNEYGPCTTYRNMRMNSPQGPYHIATDALRGCRGGAARRQEQGPSWGGNLRNMLIRRRKIIIMNDYWALAMCQALL